MKKLIMFMLAAVCAVFVGCDKELPTPDKMYAMTKTAGITAGYVANMTKISDKDRVIVIDIMGKVRECIPDEGQTFTEVWTPVADKYIQELVDAGKIDDAQAVLIKSVFAIAVKAIDYAVFNRYPKIGKDIELVNAGSSGFCDGFLSVFTPPNKKDNLLESGKLDKDLYNYLTK